MKPVKPSGTSQTLLSAITYNADSNPTGWLWADAKPRVITYDSVGQIASYSLGDPNGVLTRAGVQRVLNRDPVERIIGYSHTNNSASVPSLDQSFAYDDLNRLLSATQTSLTTQYSYDATGNRTSKTIGAATYTNTVAASSNKLTQTQDVLGTSTIVHDNAGNITADGTNTYSYSDRGRMSSVLTAGGTVAYLYNGFGQRVQKSGPTTLVSTGAAYYVYDEAGQLLGEYDAAGAPLYESVYLGSMPVAVIKQTGSGAMGNIATTLYNVHSDHLNTPRLITRQDHTIVWRWDSSEAFGGTLPDQNPSSLGIFVYNQRFPGQVFDQETGLFQNWMREYNTRTGRYIQSDPIGLNGGINTFGYVDGDPLRFTDPTGLKIFWNGHSKPSLAVIAMLVKIDDCNGDKDIYVTSTTRDKSANDKAGGAKNSRHLTGNAVDFYIPGQSSEETAAQAVGAGAMGVGTYDAANGGHTHIDDRNQEWNGFNSKTMKDRPWWRTNPNQCDCSSRGSDASRLNAPSLPFVNPFKYPFI